MSKTKTREERMPSIAKAEALRARKQSASITKHYRAIGPAAIAAALICMRKQAKAA